ncbi:SGNH/GDSL hydrolase family protein [Amycolatopsis thermophila]|uniref:Lysophospholipase L1-like esterase n=1 Tax=Amycolatopsis thermophila TaxID=206084 RepID=A0ABU0EZR2_9PSEU|nr:SGNH/GDSL hydrolase family protein [Amycolatopsis thermophila]MDQ0380743.1 lysophospholipase L1-like esterase [Amycolatopsis thermophila]
MREEFTQTPDPLPRRAARLAVLGDSTAVGLGDPVPGGAWRGVGPLVAAALGVPPSGYLNTAFTGARMRCVRTDQLPAALGHRPDVAVVIVGMNDTLRSDFDAPAMARDLEHVVTSLQSAGATVVTMRFHDHSRVFRLPGPLRRALTARITELNDVIDVVTRRHAAACLDLGALPGAYDLAAWSVDRLHPSELGHRLLARGVTELVAAAGIAVPAPVSLVCSGGITPRTIDHVGWLVVKGIPWLWRRGRDLLPYAAAIVARSMVRSRHAEPLELEPAPVEQ